MNKTFGLIRETSESISVLHAVFGSLTTGSKEESSGMFFNSSHFAGSGILNIVYFVFKSVRGTTSGESGDVIVRLTPEKNEVIVDL